MVKKQKEEKRKGTKAEQEKEAKNWCDENIENKKNMSKKAQLYNLIILIPAAILLGIHVINSVHDYLSFDNFSSNYILISKKNYDIFLKESGRNDNK